MRMLVLGPSPTRAHLDGFLSNVIGGLIVSNTSRRRIGWYEPSLTTIISDHRSKRESNDECADDFPYSDSNGS